MRGPTSLLRIHVLKITSSNLHEALLLVANCPKLTTIEIAFTGGEKRQSLNSFIMPPPLHYISPEYRFAYPEKVEFCERGLISLTAVAPNKDVFIYNIYLFIDLIPIILSNIQMFYT